MTSSGCVLPSPYSPPSSTRQTTLEAFWKSVLSLTLSAGVPKTIVRLEGWWVAVRSDCEKTRLLHHKTSTAARRPPLLPPDKSPASLPNLLHMNPNPRFKRKRRPNITSEGRPTPSSAKRKSDASAAWSDSKRRRLTKSVHLDLNAFVSLNETVMTRVCRYLHPVDMLALSRASKLLRAMFVSKLSKPCWDESRLRLGIPDWRHVSSLRAMAFIFEQTCQAVGCDEPARLQCAYLCRKYCVPCAKKNLVEAKDVQRKWPELSEDLVTRLVWTPKRPATSTNEMRKGRFYLKEDVMKLFRHFQRLKNQPSWATTAFRAQLISKQRRRTANAVEIRVWLKRTIERQEVMFKSRWRMISTMMASRWHWPVPYEELPGRLKQVVDHLINLSHITEDSWNCVRGDLTRAIKAKGPGRDQAKRPFSLRGAASPQRELASSK